MLHPRGKPGTVGARSGMSTVEIASWAVPNLVVNGAAVSLTILVAQVLQVTDMKADAIEVRILATARDAGTTFDLRCDLREAMLAFIRDEMPEALPHGRSEIGRETWARKAPADQPGV